MAKERHVSAEAALSSGTVGFDAASNASSVVEERDVCIDEVTVDILKAPFNPCIEDADPDCSPPPKDGDPIPWMDWGLLIHFVTIIVHQYEPYH